MAISISVLLLLVLLIIGSPVMTAFGLAGILSIYMLNFDSANITSTLFQSVNSFPLMAVPFFILAGHLMKDSGISEKLIFWINAFIGKVKGGLGAVMVVACAFFGAISGSAVATVASIGSVMIPLMEKYGYQRRYSSTLAGTAGFLGIIIPPSIPLILYGVTAQISIGKLFLATIIPGIIITFLFIMINRFTYLKYYQVPSHTEEISDIKSIGKLTLGALPAIFMPVIILGGIYGGIFTPTEAAAVAVVYALIIGSLLYKGIKLRTLKSIFISSAITSASILVLIAFATVFGRVLTLENIPNQLSTILIEAFPNAFVFLLVLNIFLLLVGMLMETNVAILLFTPLLLPALTEMGIDPIHFGSILILNLAVGTVTPPFSVNLFIASKVGKVPVMNLMKPLVPYLIFGALPAILITTYIPWVSIWLPSLLD